MNLSRVIENLLEEQRRKALESRSGTPTDAKECLKIIEKRVTVSRVVAYGDVDIIEVKAYYVLK